MYTDPGHARLAGVLDELLAPMRARREALAARPDEVRQVIDAGTRAARALAAEVLADVRAVFRLG